MQTQVVNRVVIVGGGTAGWITASLLSRLLQDSINITLVESEQIGTVGVGEASIPPMLNFNQALGFGEREFLAATKGTIKLGIEFVGWGKEDSRYMHAFGDVGKSFPFCDFHHLWQKGQDVPGRLPFDQYSLTYRAAKAGRFSPMDTIPGTQLPGTQHAYHFDAGLYAQALRVYSEKHGVKRVEGLIEQVEQDPTNGNISHLVLQDGQRIDGDLFIDCSGLKGLLIEQTLHTGFEDWQHYLPCDSAWAVPSEVLDPIPPYTRSRAHSAGWQWRIPLQHRTGNGIVFSQKFMSPEQAKQQLLDNLDTPAIGEPRLIEFKTGRRRKQWHRNVVSVGLSSGFLEPLESTSIHLIQTAVIRLLKQFPHQGIKQTQVDEYNRQSQLEFEQIRDFIILHYKAQQRTDSEFWRYCQQMDIPDSLATRIDAFKASGQVSRYSDELFTEVAWQQVMIGQGVLAQDYHPFANRFSDQQLTELFTSLDQLMDKTVAGMSRHEDYFVKGK